MMSDIAQGLMSVTPAPRIREEVRLADYAPNNQKRNKYRARIDDWCDHVARESTVLDEQEWKRRAQDRDPDLGFIGAQTVLHMVRLHNRMLAKVTPLHKARSGKPSDGEVSRKRRQPVPVRVCTEARPIKERL